MNKTIIKNLFFVGLGYDLICAIISLYSVFFAGEIIFIKYENETLISIVATLLIFTILRVIIDIWSKIYLINKLNKKTKKTKKSKLKINYNYTEKFLIFLAVCSIIFRIITLLNFLDSLSNTIMEIIHLIHRIYDIIILTLYIKCKK